MQVSSTLFWLLWLSLILDGVGWLSRSLMSDPKYRTYSRGTLFLGGLLSMVFVVWPAIERW